MLTGVRASPDGRLLDETPNDTATFCSIFSIPAQLLQHGPDVRFTDLSTNTAPRPAHDNHRVWALPSPLHYAGICCIF